MQTVDNVSVGKPKITGGVYRAPLGTALPTDATTALADTFKSLGYVSEDGVTNTNAPETDNLRAWGGDVVLTYQSGKDDIFEFGLIESLNVDVLSTVYGDDNVSGTLDTGITVRANGTEIPASVYVIDMVLRNGNLKRICIPNGKITDIGEITYADEDAISYPLTVTAMPGTDGDTHKEYISKPAA